MTFDDAIYQARDLWGDGEGDPEYLRGMCELIARIFPEADLDTEERAEEIERLISN